LGRFGVAVSRESSSPASALVLDHFSGHRLWEHSVEFTQSGSPGLVSPGLRLGNGVVEVV
jgi:hypothetical protein